MLNPFNVAHMCMCLGIRIILSLDNLSNYTLSHRQEFLDVFTGVLIKD